MTGSELALVDAVAWLAGERQPEHRHAVGRGCDRRLAVAGLAGRQPYQRRAGQRVEDAARDFHMRHMHRVEGAAEDRCGGAQDLRISPCPSTTYFCVVSPSSPTGPRACSLLVEMPISAPRPYS